MKNLLDNLFLIIAKSQAAPVSLFLPIYNDIII